MGDSLSYLDNLLFALRGEEEGDSMCGSPTTNYIPGDSYLRIRPVSGDLACDYVLFLRDRVYDRRLQVTISLLMLKAHVFFEVDDCPGSGTWLDRRLKSVQLNQCGP